MLRGGGGGMEEWRGWSGRVEGVKEWRSGGRDREEGWRRGGGGRVEGWSGGMEEWREGWRRGGMDRRGEGWSLQCFS